MNYCEELFGDYVGMVSGVAAHTPAKSSAAIHSCILAFGRDRNFVIAFCMRPME